jgi:hypothetical protein
VKHNGAVQNRRLRGGSILFDTVVKILPPLARFSSFTRVEAAEDVMQEYALRSVALHCSPESAIGGPLAVVQERRPHPPRRAG